MLKRVPTVDRDAVQYQGRVVQQAEATLTHTMQVKCFGFAHRAAIPVVHDVAEVHAGALRRRANHQLTQAKIPAASDAGAEIVARDFKSLSTLPVKAKNPRVKLESGFVRLLQTEVAAYGNFCFPSHGNRDIGRHLEVAGNVDRGVRVGGVNLRVPAGYQGTVS